MTPFIIKKNENNEYITEKHILFPTIKESLV